MSKILGLKKGCDTVESDRNGGRSFLTPLDSPSEIFGQCQAYEYIWQKSAVRWRKTRTAIARRIPRRDNKLPTSYLHRFNFCKESYMCWRWCPLSHQPASMSGCSSEFLEFRFLSFFSSSVTHKPKIWCQFDLSPRFVEIRLDMNHKKVQTMKR